MSPRWSARYWYLCSMTGLALLLWLTAAGVDAQSSQEPPQAKRDSSISTTPALELADCLRLAHERQPRIAVQRASLAAAEDGSRALEALKLAAVVDPEIPTRRKQAYLGVAAASAAVDQAESETVYAVTRTYFTVLYAREQERVARAIVDRLTALHEAADKQLQAGARNASATDVNRVKVYLQLAKTKQVQAAQGIKRALAALREAIGLPTDYPLEIASRPLPQPTARITREEAIAWALARRPEMIRASLFAELTCLEVEAQGTSHHKKMGTFGTADIHSGQVPQGVQNTEYRPGAVPPEMPSMLVGSRSERVKHAQSLHLRALAVVDVTHNLITLEAEDAVLRYEEAGREMVEAKVAADTGDQLADDLTKDFTSAAKVRVDDVANARVLASQARSQLNEYVYKQILALADLERITAGAFCPSWFETAKPAEATTK